MKKWLLFVFSALIVLLLILSFFIPSQIQLVRSINVKANGNAAYRNLLIDQAWVKWWPKENEQHNVKDLQYKNVVYRLEHKLFNAFAITVKKGKTSLDTELNIIALDQDSLRLVWHTKLPTTNGPFDRIRKYFLAKNISGQMDELLLTLKNFLDKSENLYGSTITQTRVKDSVLVATKLSSNRYPTTEEIYLMVDKLKNYITQKGTKETGFPMLHVDSAKGRYTTMVGIPTDTLVDGNGVDIDLKRLVLGNILVTEVKGGTFTTKHALQQVEHYVYDHNRTSPAIPYESLITDRRKEKDTAKWVTRIYYPVF